MPSGSRPPGFTLRRYERPLAERRHRTVLDLMGGGHSVCRPSRPPRRTCVEGDDGPKELAVTRVTGVVQGGCRPRFASSP
jgi:hypothetical protein